jgi:hypothetical protein
MNEKVHNSETLREYLLGGLSEEDAQRFDELAIVDGEFNGVLRNAENDLIDSYVRGELSGRPLEAFETTYFTTPERKQKVSFARSLYQIADRDPTPETPESLPQSASFGFLYALRNALRPAWLAAGALAAVCVAGLLWFAVSFRPNSIDVAVAPQNIPVNVTADPQPTTSAAEVAEPEPGTAPPTGPAEEKQAVAAKPKTAPIPERRAAPLTIAITLPAPVRGAENVKTLKLPPNAEKAIFNLGLDAPDFARYSVEVRDPSSHIVWRSGRLRSSGTTLTVSVPVDDLKQPAYTISVSGVSADGTAEIIGDYPFRIVR